MHNIMLRFTGISGDEEVTDEGMVYRSGGLPFPMAPQNLSIRLSLAKLSFTSSYCKTMLERSFIIPI